MKVSSRTSRQGSGGTKAATTSRPGGASKGAGQGSRGAGDKIEAAHSPFLEAFKVTSDELTTKELEEMLLNVDEAAQALMQDPIYENMITYKDMVKRLMKETLSRLYRVRERMSRRNFEEKIYVIVEEVDKRLTALTEEILASQVDPLTLVAKLDEIRGMLVDLYT
ncbi:MAG: YaaR family protein [bacterium]|nr:YaaR family protein [bacterium]